MPSIPQSLGTVGEVMAVEVFTLLSTVGRALAVETCPRHSLNIEPDYIVARMGPGHGSRGPPRLPRHTNVHSSPAAFAYYLFLFIFFPQSALVTRSRGIPAVARPSVDILFISWSLD
ncbi:hypothetical protein J6590_003462 [Homalodisca vitripennis]|nr:hypothetical protein J6590_003462 [Homalodisca vitripennis]